MDGRRLGPAIWMGRAGAVEAWIEKEPHLNKKSGKRTGQRVFLSPKDVRMPKTKKTNNAFYIPKENKRCI